MVSSINYDEEVEKLIKFIRTNFTSKLPSTFEPPSEHLDTIENEFIKELFERFKAAKVDRDGVFTVTVDEVLDLVYSKLLVRKSYIDLSYKVLKNRRWSLILGSPGIGKTVFSFFLMILLVKARNVPFLFNIAGISGIHFWGKTYALQDSYLRKPSGLRKYDNLFYLHDADMEPPLSYRRMSIINFTSQKSRYRNFQKGSTQTLYMPLWDEKEIITLNSKIPVEFGKLDQSVLKERFDFAGGVPRHIFVDWDSYLNRVNHELVKITPEYLTANDDMYLEMGPHVIVGAYVVKNYTDFRCTFLSENLKNYVVDKLFPKNYTQFLEYVFSKADLLSRHELLGQVFGEVVGRIFCSAINISLIPLNPVAKAQLGTRKNWILHLPLAQKMIVQTPEEIISNASDIPKFWIPMSGNFPVIDYFYTLPTKDENHQKSSLVIGLQVTVNINHGINHGKLEDLVKLFGDKFVLVWVLGETNYMKQFRSQKQYIGDHVTNKEINVAQFKMNILENSKMIDAKMNAVDDQIK